MPGPNAEEYSAYYWASKHLLADSEETCPARRTARWFSDTGAYQYYFSHVPKSSPPGQGTSHADDIPFIFDVTKGDDASFFVQGAGERHLAASINSMWRAFAKTGIPDSTWPKFVNGTQEFALRFDVLPKFGGKGLVTIKDLRRQQCDFWDRYVDASPKFLPKRLP
eukprot:g5586.t1